MHRSILSLTAFLLIAVASVGFSPAEAAEAADPGLIAAIEAVDEAGVRAAIARGADVRAADPDGTTPLHWAVHANAAAIVGLLLDAGADATAANRYGVRPLSLACTNGNAAVAERGEAEHDGSHRPGCRTARYADDPRLGQRHAVAGDNQPRVAIRTPRADLVLFHHSNFAALLPEKVRRADTNDATADDQYICLLSHSQASRLSGILTPVVFRSMYSGTLYAENLR